MKTDDELRASREAGTGFKFGKSAEYWWDQAVAAEEELKRFRERSMRWERNLKGDYRWFCRLCVARGHTDKDKVGHRKDCPMNLEKPDEL